MGEFFFVIGIERLVVKGEVTGGHTAFNFADSTVTKVIAYLENSFIHCDVIRIGGREY